eukprot:UN02520
MIKEVAQKYGKIATFMPKPFTNKTGNGLHMHITMHDKDDKNVFKSDTDDLSEIGMHFLGGVMELTPALCAITNPCINSYKRMNAPPTDSGATWSPNKISWGGNT